MLQRYKMYRGSRPADDPLPNGVRMDTRRHTRHCLRPPAALVDAYLAAPSDAAWATFAEAYRRALAERFETDPKPFEDLATLASSEDVAIGCSCPTRQNPLVARCHTVLALRFMKERFPDLDVRFPPT
ncbi:MAG: DUF488 family protein, N3 subclade [Planctomycetota bacterium]|jgi:hypothetical protein